MTPSRQITAETSGGLKEAPAMDLVTCNDCGFAAAAAVFLDESDSSCCTVYADSIDLIHDWDEEQ